VLDNYEFIQHVVYMANDITTTYCVFGELCNTATISKTY